MAAKKGNGLLLVLSEAPAEHDAEFNRWYNEEHIPERLSIPGVLNAARYEAVAGGPRYLACYELASPDAWHSEAWQKWLKIWASQQMRSNFYIVRRDIKTFSINSSVCYAPN